MGFVEDNVFESLIEKGTILWAAKHVFKHRIISNNDIGNVCSCRFAALPSAWSPFLPPDSCETICLWCLTREVEKAQFCLHVKQFVEAVYLICHEGVHRIEDEAPHSVGVLLARAIPEAREDGQ